MADPPSPCIRMIDENRHALPIAPPRLSFRSTFQLGSPFAPIISSPNAPRPRPIPVSDSARIARRLDRAHLGRLRNSGLSRRDQAGHTPDVGRRFGDLASPGGAVAASAGSPARSPSIDPPHRRDARSSGRSRSRFSGPALVRPPRGGPMLRASPPHAVGLASSSPGVTPPRVRALARRTVHAPSLALARVFHPRDEPHGTSPSGSHTPGRDLFAALSTSPPITGTATTRPRAPPQRTPHGPRRT